MAESPKFSRHKGNQGRGTRRWRQILDRKWKYIALSFMRHASGHNYRNSSFIVDVAMGQIPRSTERISSFKYFQHHTKSSNVVLNCTWNLSVVIPCNTIMTQCWYKYSAYTHLHRKKTI